MQEELPQKTVRDLAEVIAYLADLVFKKLRNLLRALAPLVGPPDDMEVRTRDGSEYSGLVVLEANEVTAGVVTRVGQNTLHYNPLAHERHRPTSEPKTGSALRHWATDPRSDEDEPWRR